MELIFRQTINRINLDKSRMSKPRLEAQVARINQKDSFHAAKVGQLSDTNLPNSIDDVQFVSNFFPLFLLPVVPRLLSQFVS